MRLGITFTSALAVCGSLFLVAPAARADGTRGCPRPVRLLGCGEWSFYGAIADARTSDAGWKPSFGLGAELAWVVGRYHGFPSGSYYGSHGDAEVAVGAWGAASARGERGLVEGGLKVHDGGGWHASWGTFDLRAGAGYARFGEGRAGHAVVTIAYGVRSALFRYDDRRAQQALRGKTDVARVFATYRRALDGSSASEIVLGLELSPTFFFAPTTWWRVGGGPPM
jgi:hypothetical protein